MLDLLNYDFMKYALVAILLVSPIFAILGTMIINNKMAFFSDIIGHSSLTGLAIGILLGLKEPLWAMIALAVLLALAVGLLKKITNSSSDTVLGVLFSFVTALGVVLLSSGGNFSRYSVYLIGDVVAVSGEQFTWLIIIFIITVFYWIIFGNRLLLIGINPLLAKSREVNVFLVEISFSILVAVIVVVSIRLVGILVINSLLILPAAAARNVAKNSAQYMRFSIIISIFSGLSGLLIAFYIGTAAGATIALVSAGIYVFTLVVKKWN